MSFVAIKMGRLGKQPTDLRRKACYFGDRTLKLNAYLAWNESPLSSDLPVLTRSMQILGHLIAGYGLWCFLFFSLRWWRYSSCSSFPALSSLWLL